MGHMSNMERLGQLKNDVDEVVTFHSGEQNELEDFTKNIKPETV